MMVSTLNVFKIYLDEGRKNYTTAEHMQQTYVEVL
jgi:hypothetical protein